GTYYPGTSSGYQHPVNSFRIITYASPSATCPNPCNTPYCNQHHIKKAIVLEDEFSSLSEGAIYQVQRIAYENLLTDTSLMHLSNENDSILKAFYNLKKDGNFEEFRKATNFSIESATVDAEESNESI